MNCIILGDQFKKGMKSKGCSGLIQVNRSINIFQQQYDTLLHLYQRINIIYVYGYDAKKFIHFITKNHYIEKLTIIYNENNYDNHNSIQGLKLAHNFLNQDCLILSGDTIITKKTFNHFSKHKGSQVFLAGASKKTELGCVLLSSKIEHICYGLGNSLHDIYYFSKKDIGDFKNLLLDSKKSNCFIFEIINDLIDKNILFTTC